MRYRALVSFSGLELSMAQGEVRDITDSALADSLNKVGYIMPMESQAEKKADETAEEPEDKPKTKRKGKK